MTTSIEITQLDTDKTDYLRLIVELLNKRFTTQEQMEMSWQLNCLDVAQELGSRLIIEQNYICFDFTTK